MKLSQEKQKKISEQVLATLFLNAPRSLFTSELAKETARDEDFMRKLLDDLTEKKVVEKITKNPQGIPYTRRIRWKLSDEAYLQYMTLQKNQVSEKRTFL